MGPDLAPATVAQIQALVRQGFYDGIVFHRVIDGFMAQPGDPQGNGTGGCGQWLKAAFCADNQVVIVFARAPSLDGKHTGRGKIVAGMEYSDQVKKGDAARDGTVTSPDKIIKMQVFFFSSRRRHTR